VVSPSSCVSNQQYKRFSSDTSRNSQSSPTTVTITAYVICAAEFLFRFTKNFPLRAVSLREKQARVGMPVKIKVMVGAMSFSSVLLFIRSVYRLIELSDGWTGRIIRTELYFDVLDGTMIVLAIYTVNFIHPGMFSPSQPPKVKETVSRESDV
jgi:hypothetical protein